MAQESWKNSGIVTTQGSHPIEKIIKPLTVPEVPPNIPYCLILNKFLKTLSFHIFKLKVRKKILDYKNAFTE